MGPPGDPEPSCQTRAQVHEWYRRGRDAGVRARVIETQVSGDKILVGLAVTGRPDAAEDGRREVLTVREGRIAAIEGFDDRDEAAAWAGLASV